MSNPCRLCIAALFSSVLVMLAGCPSSPPAQFIALNSTNQPGARINIGQPPLRLGRIQLDSALDRPYLVRQTGPNTRNISQTVRWISPLDQQIHQTLGNDLADQIGPNQFISSDTDNVKARVLTLSIERFSANSHNVVHLVADWHIMPPDSTNHTSTGSNHNDVMIKAKSGAPADIAAAMSRAVGQLAKRIATDLKRNHPS